MDIMEKSFFIQKYIVKIVRSICTWKSEVLTGMPNFITRVAFQKWLPVIFCLLALRTSFCGTKSVVYIVLFDVYVRKCCYCDFSIFHVVSAIYNAGDNIKNKQDSYRSQGHRAFRLWNGKCWQLGCDVIPSSDFRGQYNAAKIYEFQNNMRSHTDLLISFHSPPLWEGPQCFVVCCRSPRAHRS